MMQGRFGQGGGLICRITECQWRQYRSRVHPQLVRFLTTTSRKQRRRKHRPQLRQTTRTRLRLLLKDPDAKPVMAHVAQATNFLEARLNEAQNLVRGFWNRGAARDLPTMDRMWWIQNIILALSPAALMVLAMELWGKPYVERRSKEIELISQLKLRLLEEEDADDVDAEQESDLASPSNITENAKQPQSSHDSDPVLSHEISEVHPATDVSNELTTVDLHRRIKMLEQKLEKQAREMERLVSSQKYQGHQSGIQNRVNQKLKLKDLETKKDATTTTKEPVKLDLFTVAEEWMARNFRDKRDAIIESGRQLLDLMHSEDSSKGKVDPGERLIVSGPSPTTETPTVTGQVSPTPAESTGASTQQSRTPVQNPTIGQEEGWLSWTRIFPQRSQKALDNKTNPESKPSGI